MADIHCSDALRADDHGAAQVDRDSDRTGSGGDRVFGWIVLASLALVSVSLIPIGHDAVWAIWIGRQMLNGATLYRDIIEVNPPLWFWLAVPQAALGLEADHTVRLFFVGAIALSLWLIPAKYRLPSLAAFAVLPLIDFGQREHFTLIATAPYVFLAARRASGESGRYPVLIGVLAAVGFALKPYFVVVPIAIELALWRSTPRFRPETITLGLCAVAYAAAVPLFAPAYLSEIIPQVVQYYGHFTGTATYRLLIAAVVIAMLGAASSKRTGSPESRMLALTALAFLPAVVLQAKGWSYQTILVRGFLFLAIVAELMRLRRSPWADSLLVAAAVLCFSPFGIYRNSREAETNQHLAGLPPGTTITAITANPSMVWPMIEDRKLTWTSRQFCTWQIFAAQHDARYLPAIRELIAEEVGRRPQVIIVDRRKQISSVVDQVVTPKELAEYRLHRRTRLMDSYLLNP